MFSKNNCGLVQKSKMLKKSPNYPFVTVVDESIMIVDAVYYDSR